MVNRLAESTSPYLLQHKDNPVEWWPWCEEAFAEARRRNVPVLLSIGYAACHWCHVMAHESFEDDAVAAVMNEHFINIKVDREERPDVDAVYMEAVQAMTGHGGWPMTAFLTPSGAPFFCGTYYPPTPRYGMPSFRQVLLSVAAAWRDRRGDIERAGAHIVKQLAERPGPPAGGQVSPEVLDIAATSLHREYDAQLGGFGGAPKFPPSMCLEFLLRRYARTRDRDSLDMVTVTCERMARGGIYDQLGGGFARYSVDAAWVVPHFEKMLYDNALLLRVYAHLWRITESALAARVVRETAEFLLRDLRTPQGGFASSLDADTEGEEGKFYVWTPAQLVDALGPADGRWAADVLAVTDAGTFEHGTSVLQLLADPADETRYADVRARLFAARARRVPPGRDDKVVAAWNGLAIAAFADAGALLGEQSWVQAAREAAELLTAVHLVDGRLRRTSRDGRVGDHAGVLEDYADVAEALIALASVTGEERWLRHAGALLDTTLTRFRDAAAFYDTADDAERLIRRPQDLTDNATPAGTSAVAGALLGYAALSGSTEHRTAAEDALRSVALLLPRHARFAGWAAAVAEAVLAGPAEVAIVGPPDDPTTRALESAARRSPSPGAVVAVGRPQATPWAPLLADRPLVDGRPAAYVCRSFVCARPVTEPQELARLLDG